MKRKQLLILVFMLTLILPLHSQDDVKLFDFWKYYSDAENAMYKSSCKLAFKQLDDRKAEIARLHTKDDYLERQVEVM